MPCVYILKSLRNGTYYIGSTKNFQRRLKEHERGKSKYTRSLLPIEEVFMCEFKSIKQAKKAEAWIKKQKSRVFIERLIREGTISKSFQ